MFGTLESTWDQSTHRGWTTLASFAAQAFALSLLLAISLIWAGGPPQVRWIGISAPASFAPQALVPALRDHRANSADTVSKKHSEKQRSEKQWIVAPPSLPDHIAPINDADARTGSDTAAPTLDCGQCQGHGPGDSGIAHSIGDGIPVVVPPRPVPIKPLLVSHLSEANLLRKVQPVYPPLARQARVQGEVELRAIIGKTGAIENLIVVRGHPMLAAAAVEAVRQWRYRPYLLNNEPIEVETDITVTFLLSGG